CDCPALSRRSLEASLWIERVYCTRPFEGRFAATSDPMEAAGGQKVGLSLQKQPPSEDQAMQLDHTDTPAEQDYATVHVALELSKKKWLLGMMLPGSQKISRYTIAGGDVARLTEQLQKTRAT